jgi:hypothetical protein
MELPLAEMAESLASRRWQQAERVEGAITAMSERHAEQRMEAAVRIANYEAERREEIQRRIADAERQTAQTTATAQSAAATGVIDAWGAAAQSVITGSESASVAMLRAFVQSIRSIVMAYAAQASAAAFAANAGIPVVGIAAGTAAAGVAFGLVEAMVGQIPSAAGGYDIPAGVSPLTQLHEREMVLPARIAEPLRESLDSGGGLGGAVNVTISAMDGASVQRVIESPAFAAAMREARRNGRL